MGGEERKREREHDVSGVASGQGRECHRDEIVVGVSFLDRANEGREDSGGEGVDGCEVAWQKRLGV